MGHPRFGCARIGCFYFWQMGQKWVLRPPRVIFWMGVWQTRQGLPVRR